MSRGLARLKEQGSPNQRARNGFYRMYSLKSTSLTDSIKHKGERPLALSDCHCRLSTVTAAMVGKGPAHNSAENTFQKARSISGRVGCQEHMHCTTKISGKSEAKL